MRTGICGDKKDSIYFKIERITNEWFISIVKKIIEGILVRMKKGFTFAIPLDEKACKKAFGSGADL